MSNPILFVCQSCRAAQAESSDRPAEGTILLNDLLNLYQEWSHRSELEIQPVGCLWTCDYPCAIALSCPQKSTYVLANIPVAEDAIAETAAAVLCLSQRYLESKDGNIPWNQFPAVLQTDIVARIPAAMPIAVRES